MIRIGLIGAESTGKSTLALLLTGRLRTHGVLAAMVAESGSELPFAAPLLDSQADAHAYMIANKMALEARFSLRPNIEFLVSDRTPLDHSAYYLTRFTAQSHRMRALCESALFWAAHYDAIYYLPTKGTTYREDGFRMPAADNDFRERVDGFIRDRVPSLPNAIEVTGSYRERCEFVYHHVLSTFFGKTRPLRAYKQVLDWLTARGFRIVEVRPQGSNSITRFHPSSDSDDIDAMIVVDGDANYAIEVRADIELHRVQLENIVQADLDLLVTPKGLEAHEA